MTKKAYLITFDTETIKNEKFHEELTALPEVLHWSHYIKSSYVIITNETSATNLSNKIDSLIPNTRYLIIEVKIGNENGVLPVKAWEWFSKHTN